MPLAQRRHRRRIEIDADRTGVELTADQMLQQKRARFRRRERRPQPHDGAHRRLLHIGGERQPVLAFPPAASGAEHHRKRRSRDIELIDRPCLRGRVHGERQLASFDDDVGFLRPLGTELSGRDVDISPPGVFAGLGRDDRPRKTQLGAAGKEARARQSEGLLIRLPGEGAVDRAHRDRFVIGVLQNEEAGAGLIFARRFVKRAILADGKPRLAGKRHVEIERQIAQARGQSDVIERDIAHRHVQARRAIDPVAIKAGGLDTHFALPRPIFGADLQIGAFNRLIKGQGQIVESVLQSGALIFEDHVTADDAGMFEIAQRRGTGRRRRDDMRDDRNQTRLGRRQSRIVHGRRFGRQDDFLFAGRQRHRAIAQNGEAQIEIIEIETARPRFATGQPQRIDRHGGARRAHRQAAIGPA